MTIFTSCLIVVRLSLLLCLACLSFTFFPLSSFLSFPFFVQMSAFLRERRAALLRLSPVAAASAAGSVGYAKLSYILYLSIVQCYSFLRSALLCSACFLFCLLSHPVLSFPFLSCRSCPVLLCCVVWCGACTMSWTHWSGCGKLETFFKKPE